MQWFRFYHEALDDPKVQTLDAETFRDWVNLLCLCCRMNGELPKAVEQIAFVLRRSPDACLTVLSRLADAGLLDRRNGGPNGMHYAIHAWDKRQYKSDTSTDRVKRFRERYKDVSETVTVTPPDTETETETDKKIKNTPLPPSRGNDGFDLFWEAYPRKVGKGAAAKAWRVATRKASADEIVSSVKRFSWPDDKQFIPHPSTWLNAERWTDEASKPASFTPAYRPPVFVPPPPDPTMTPEHRERMAAKFDDLLRSLGKSKEM